MGHGADLALIHCRNGAAICEISLQSGRLVPCAIYASKYRKVLKKQRETILIQQIQYSCHFKLLIFVRYIAILNTVRYRRHNCMQFNRLRI